MTKVFSIRIPVTKEAGVPQLIKLPELQNFLDTGWELINTFPVESNDMSYLFSFVVQHEDEPVTRKRKLR